MKYLKLATFIVVTAIAWAALVALTGVPASVSGPVGMLLGMVAGFWGMNKWVLI